MHSQAPIDRRPGLKPPQFGLGTLLLFIAIISACLVAVQQVSPLLAAVVTLFLLAVFAHVAGNALGTQLRASGDTRRLHNGEEIAARLSGHKPLPIHTAPVTRLSGHTRLGKWTLIPAVLGAVAGGTCGGVLLARVNWEHATIANIALGTISFAVLGGLWGFWAGRFLSILGQTVFHAHRESRHEDLHR